MLGEGGARGATLETCLAKIMFVSSGCGSLVQDHCVDHLMCPIRRCSDHRDECHSEQHGGGGTVPEGRSACQ